MSFIEFTTGMHLCPNCEDESFLDEKSELAQFLKKGVCTEDNCDCKHIGGPGCMGWRLLAPQHRPGLWRLDSYQVSEAYDGGYVFPNLGMATLVDDYYQCPDCDTFFRLSDSPTETVYGCNECFCVYDSKSDAIDCGCVKEEVEEKVTFNPLPVIKQDEPKLIFVNSDPLIKLAFDDITADVDQVLKEGRTDLLQKTADNLRQLQENKKTESAPPRRDPFRRQDGS